MLDDDLTGTRTDVVGELRWAEALLAAEVRLLERVARGEPLRQVLDALSRHVEDLCQGCFCSILLVAPGRTHFAVGAGPSLPDAYNAILDGKTIDGGYGPCSLAILLNARIITADLANDPRWEGSAWVPLMRTHGYASCWSMPIVSVSGETCGVFAIYRRDPVSPTPREEELIDRFTKIAGIVIDRARADEALKAREAELQRANAYLTEAQRVSKTGSFSWDVEADEHNWSGEIRRIFGIDPDVSVSLGLIQAAIHPDDLAEVERVIGGAAEGRDFDLVFRIRTLSGEVRHAHAVGHRMAAILDRPVFLGAVQDVTESRLAEEALDRARAELAHVARVATLNAMTASIGHEVSQPLSGILTNASTCVRMLTLEPPDLAGATVTARRTIRDANRASEVIQRLRAMFSKAAPTLERLDLNEAAREVTALLAGELQRSDALVQTAFAEALPPVSADRVQLQQVILNLLLNAADAMAGVNDRPRTLLIATRLSDDGCVGLDVRDAGAGVDPATVEKLFEAFYTTKPDGMGVGLSICRSIIESHEGRLWAAPNPAAPGATFSFRIPAARG